MFIFFLFSKISLLNAALLANSSRNSVEFWVNITWAGEERNALVHLPPRPGEMPMVLNYHVLMGDPENQEDISQMNVVADREQFIVVYPEGLLKGNIQGWLPGGTGKSWNGGTCCPKDSTSKVDDVGFSIELVSYLQSNMYNLTNGLYIVDPSRVYGAGGSNGGFMVNRVACEAPGLFAAIGPVAGVIGNGRALVWGSDPYDCPVRDHVVPVIHFHGKKDPMVPWVGNPLLGFQSVPNYIKERKQLAHTGNDRGTVSYQNGRVTCTYYGTAKTNFTFCEHPKGHCWPGTQATCTHDISASDEIWNFFQQFRKEIF